MKRHNIYLYPTEGQICKPIGFCRIDTFDNNLVKIQLRINPMKHLCTNCDVSVKLLTTSNTEEPLESIHYPNIANGLSLRTNVNFSDERIFGISVELSYSDRTILLKGVINNRVCNSTPHKEAEAEPSSDCSQSSFTKLTAESLLNMPTKYWCLVKNKFLFCNYNKYGHFGLLNKDGQEIVCVPGVLNDKTSACARRHGFKGYIPNTYTSDEDITGYYYMRF